MNTYDILIMYLVAGLLASVALSVLAIRAKVIRRGAMPQSVICLLYTSPSPRD